MQISFKAIIETDVNQLMEIAIKTFKQAYEHLNSTSNFNWYLNRAFTKNKLISEIQNKESFYYFITNENNIIGYFKLNIGNSQTEKHSEEFLEIERIYLDTNYYRKGIGSKVIEFAFKKAKGLSKTRIWLGVWDKNPKAIYFYEAIGFKQKGSHIFKFGDEDQIDLIFETAIPHRF